ncbi:5'-3' DNA helicase ZGRF1 [Pelodytes ibericus]
MASQVFTVLYTHQKTKKSKVWQDGILKTSPEGNIATLYSDKGQRLESVFLKVPLLSPGDDLESDRYLITVEAEDAGSGVPQASSEVREVPFVNRNVRKPVGLGPPVGMKRKFTGFQGPREIIKKPSLDLESTCKVSSPVVAAQCSSLPPQLYATSPLFSVPCIKTQKLSITAEHGSDAWMTRTVAGDKQNGYMPCPLPNKCSVFSNIESRSSAAETHKGAISTTQSIRSTTQILSLLKSKPPLLKSMDSPSKPNEKRSSNDNNEKPHPSRTTISGKASDLVHPQESSTKSLHGKSRWEIYLAQPKSPHTEEGSKENGYLSPLIHSPGESLNLGRQESLSSFTRQDKTDKAIDIVDPEYLQPSLQTGTADASYSVLKTEGLEEHSLLKNVELSSQPLVKGFYTHTSSKIQSLKHGTSVRGMTGCIPALEPSHSHKLSNSILDNANKLCSPALANSQEVDLENEVDNEVVSEVTFNLLDSFDFEDLDEEDLPMSKPILTNSSHLVERCVALEKVEPEILGNLSGKETDFVENVLVDEKMPLCNQEPDNKKTRFLISDEGLGERKRNKADHQDDEISFSSVDLNVSPTCGPDTVSRKSPDQGTNVTRITNSTSSFLRFSTGFDSNFKADLQCGKSLTTFSSDSKLMVGKLANDDKDNFQTGYKIEAEGHIEMCEGSARSSHPEPVLRDEDYERENPRPPTIAIIMHHSDEETGIDSSDLSQTGNGISVLKTLTQHSTALDSLNILKGKCISTSWNNDCARPTWTQSREEEVPQRVNAKVTMAPSDLYEEEPSFNADLSFSPMLHRDNLQQSPITQAISPKRISANNTEDKLSFTSNGHFKTISEQIPSRCNSIKSSSAECNLGQWIEDSQKSDYDWDLSQWPFKETNVEEFGDISRTSKLRSRLQMQVPVLTTPDIAVCSTSKELDCAYKTNNLDRFSMVCHEKAAVMEEGNIFVEHTVKDNDNSKPQNSSANMGPSKWAKYQSLTHSSLLKNSKRKSKEFCAHSVFGKKPDTTEDNVMDGTRAAHVDLSNNYPDHHNSSNNNGQRLQLLSKCLTSDNHFPPQSGKKSILPGSHSEQILLSSDLCFPGKKSVLSGNVPKRKIRIPAVFQSAAHYKQVFSGCLTEHLNILMFELSQQLHKALSKVDMSFYTSLRTEDTGSKDSNAPHCLHHQPAKLVMVKKEGPNKGRLFYTCDAAKAEQCKFFKWMEDVKFTDPQGKSQHKAVMGDMRSLSSYVRCQHISLHEESQLMIRKMSGFHHRPFGKFKKIKNADSMFGDESKTKLYLKLSRKDNSSAYSKDDLWIISKTLNFDPMDTFIACSVFFGPSANNDIEIFPLKGYHPSNWPSNMVVHALLVCNTSTELTCLRNIQEHFNASTLPLMPQLLKMNSELANSGKVTRGKFNPPNLIGKVSHRKNLPDYKFVVDLAVIMVKQFCLNEDQAAALMQISKMISSTEGLNNEPSLPITIIHGVFGAGKSYLLAVVVLFLIQIFETTDSGEDIGSSPWKILISSSTNVAVDRVLLGLLDLQFDQFIRVGSVRKIAKPILPYSLQAGSENESEQLKELLALLKDDLTPVEKAYVRKSIEQHKLGTNKALLGQVRVVGATCAACPFTCLNSLTFPVVILDECSQMTEPASMLPIARFQCEKLILVGDPKQLSPTIQGSEAAHNYGLEQTLFDRLCIMGHKAVMLRTQYRCHPAISAIANELFYENHLLNGVSEEDRRPTLDWLPTLCFYNANGIEEVEGSNSFHNVEEASFTVKLIQSLIASGIAGCMIGVITLYKAQMYKICTLLSSTLFCDPKEVKAVQVSTVDAFQGAEKDIIILSCVRTKQVGFIDSEKRMNVALTRGKNHLLIVGSLACLRRSKQWEHVIHHCERQRNGLKHVSQWEEKLNAILDCYQENKSEEDRNVQKMKPPKKDGKMKIKGP